MSARFPMKCDPQQNRLYRMEDSFMLGYMRQRPASRTELQKVANEACKRWNVRPVRVVFASDPAWCGAYIAGTDTIELYIKAARRHGRNVAVLLHEVAHHIDDMRYSESEDWDSHGPYFAAVEMDLLDHFGVLSKKAYQMLAADYGVYIAFNAKPPRRRKRK